MNRQVFFAIARNAPFGGVLTQQNVEGVECIIDAFFDAGGHDLRHLAYILATAFHETGGKMMPVREGFANTDKEARQRVLSLIRKRGLRDYVSPDPETGHSYYGRGYVQLTWADNYRRMGHILNLPLFENPDLVLDPKISARVLVEGMTRGVSGKGDFTGKSLSDYFSDDRIITDPVGARRIINGTDKAEQIAKYYDMFLSALEASKEPEKQDVDLKDAEPDRPDLKKDKTTIGAVTSSIGAAGVTGAIGAINNPWAFGAVVIFGILLAVGAFLFFTGRLKIAKNWGA